jgi:hypothetical protein
MEYLIIKKEFNINTVNMNNFLFSNLTENETPLTKNLDVDIISEEFYQLKESDINQSYNVYKTLLDRVTIRRYRDLLTIKNDEIGLFDYRKIKDNEFLLYFLDNLTIHSDKDAMIKSTDITIIPKIALTNENIINFIIKVCLIDNDSKKIYLKKKYIDEILEYNNIQVI